MLLRFCKLTPHMNTHRAKCKGNARVLAKLRDRIYVAAPSLYGLRDNSYKIGSRAAMKIHGFVVADFRTARLFFLLPTAGLIKYIKI